MNSSKITFLYIIFHKFSVLLLIQDNQLFLYKWIFLKKIKTFLEAYFYKHDFYVFIITLGEKKNYRALGADIDKLQNCYKKSIKMTSSSK